MIALNQNSRPGRKPLLDEAKRREICEVLAVGGTRTMAAAYVGCSLDTIARAAKRDRAFAKELRRASVECEIRFLRSLSNAAQDPKQWRAAAWALERLYPERYARRKPDTITHEQLRKLLGSLRIPKAGERITRRRPAARRQPIERGGVPAAPATAETAVGRQGVRRSGAPSYEVRQSAPAACSETQNRPAETVTSSGKTRSSAPPRPISRSTKRVPTPQNSRRENPEITEKDAVFAAGPPAAATLAMNATPQNHPPIGEKLPNHSRKSPPRLDELAQNRKKLFPARLRKIRPAKVAGTLPRAVRRRQRIAGECLRRFADDADSTLPARRDRG